MKRSSIVTLWRMLTLVRPLTGFMCLAVLTGTLACIAVQAIPVLGGYAVLCVLGCDTPMGLTAICAVMVGLALLRAVLRYAEQRTNHYIAFTLLAIVRDRVFRALRRLSPARLCGRDKGDLISLITSDVELLEVFYAHTISPVCIAALTTLVTVLFIGSFHWSLGLLALGSLVAVGVILPVLVSRISGSTGEVLRVQSGELASHVLESIRGLDETIQYGGAASRMEGMRQRTQTLTAGQGRLSRLTGVNRALANTLILVSDVSVLMLGMHLYTSGSIAAEGLLIPVLTLMSGFGPVSALAGLGTTLQSTIASGRRVLDILGETPETEEITGCSPVQFEGASCENVRFSYDGREVLHDLSLRIGPGHIIGIVGRSGSGKSTLLRLLMRFWKVTGGRVCISQRDINTINTADLRDMESYMTQDTELFQDTIRENIRIADLSADDAAVEAAARKAALHEFIVSLPEGYDTPVGELGSTLSGGERQRIGLARAFLHDAPLMLLDEPTSNLDSLNEAVILRSLREEGAGRTVVLVSHRESTVRIADIVHRAENGGLH